MRGIIAVIESVTRDGVIQDCYGLTLPNSTVQVSSNLESGLRSGSGSGPGSVPESGPGSGPRSGMGSGPGSLFNEIGWLERLNAVTDAYHWLIKSKYLTPQQVFSSLQFEVEVEVEVEVVIKAERGSKRKASVLSSSSSEYSSVPKQHERQSSSAEHFDYDSQSDTRPRIFKFLRNFMDACHFKILKGDIE